MRKRTHAFQSSRRSGTSSDPSPSKKLGWYTFASANASSRPGAVPSSHGRRSTPASAVTSSQDFRLYVATASRLLTLSQWCVATSVSSAKMRSADAAASGSPARSRIRSMCPRYAVRTASKFSSR